MFQKSHARFKLSCDVPNFGEVRTVILPQAGARSSLRGGEKERKRGEKEEGKRGEEKREEEGRGGKFENCKYSYTN